MEAEIAQGMRALIVGALALLEQGVETPEALESLPTAQWSQVLRFAAAAAALNCMREGADPPRRSEVDALIAA